MEISESTNLPECYDPFILGSSRNFSISWHHACGGLAMVEPIRRHVMLEKEWLSQQKFLDGLALCQLVPGATVAQLATYVGFSLCRTRRGFLAATAFIVPAFLLLLGLSFLHFRYSNLSWVRSVFRGFSAVVYRPLSAGLMVAYPRHSAALTGPGCPSRPGSPLE